MGFTTCAPKARGHNETWEFEKMVGRGFFRWEPVVSSFFASCLKSFEFFKLGNIAGHFIDFCSKIARLSFQLPAFQLGFQVLVLVGQPTKQRGQLADHYGPLGNALRLSTATLLPCLSDSEQVDQHLQRRTEICGFVPVHLDLVTNLQISFFFEFECVIFGLRSALVCLRSISRSGKNSKRWFLGQSKCPQSSKLESTHDFLDIFIGSIPVFFNSSNRNVMKFQCFLLPKKSWEGTFPTRNWISQDLYDANQTSSLCTSQSCHAYHDHPLPIGLLHRFPVDLSAANEACAANATAHLDQHVILLLPHHVAWKKLDFSRIIWRWFCDCLFFGKFEWG